MLLILLANGSITDDVGLEGEATKFHKPGNNP